MKFEISDFKHGIFDVEGTLIDNKRVYRWLVSKISLALEPNGSELFFLLGACPFLVGPNYFVNPKPLLVSL